MALLHDSANIVPLSFDVLDGHWRENPWIKVRSIFNDANKRQVFFSFQRSLTKELNETYGAIRVHAVGET